MTPLWHASFDGCADAVPGERTSLGFWVLGLRCKVAVCKASGRGCRAECCVSVQLVAAQGIRQRGRFSGALEFGGFGPVTGTAVCGEFGLRQDPVLRKSLQTF